MGSYRLLLVALLVPLMAAGLAACIAIPIPQNHDIGHAVSIDPAGIGVMTKQEVLAKWGEPSSIWEHESIFAYSWDHVSWGILIGSGMDGFGAGGFVEFPTHYVLFVQFDADDRVRRAERVLVPEDIASAKSGNYSELAANWSQRQDTAAK